MGAVAAAVFLLGVRPRAHFTGLILGVDLPSDTALHIQHKWLWWGSRGASWRSIRVSNHPVHGDDVGLLLRECPTRYCVPYTAQCS